MNISISSCWIECGEMKYNSEEKIIVTHITKRHRRRIFNIICKESLCKMVEVKVFLKRFELRIIRFVFGFKKKTILEQLQSSRPKVETIHKYLTRGVRVTEIEVEQMWL